MAGNKKQQMKSRKSSRKSTGKPRVQRPLPASYRMGKRATAPVMRGMADGTSVLKYSEQWFTVRHDAAAGHTTAVFKNFGPGQSGMPWLDQYGRTFDQYRIRSVELEYEPAVGTTADGFLTMGIDYDGRDLPNIGNARVLSPRAVGPFWEKKRLRVDAKRAQKARWMYCASSSRQPIPGSSSDIMQTAFTVVCDIQSTETKTYGSVWAHYEIEFCGPQQNLINEHAIGAEAVATFDFNGNGVLPVVAAGAHTAITDNYGVDETNVGSVTGAPGTLAYGEATFPITEQQLVGAGSRLYRLIIDMAAGWNSSGWVGVTASDFYSPALGILADALHITSPVGAYENFVMRYEATVQMLPDVIRLLGNELRIGAPMNFLNIAYDDGVGYSLSLVPLAGALIAATNTLSPSTLTELPVEETEIGGRKVKTTRRVSAGCPAKHVPGGATVAPTAAEGALGRLGRRA